MYISINVILWFGVQLEFDQKTQQIDHKKLKNTVLLLLAFPKDQQTSTVSMLHLLCIKL